MLGMSRLRPVSWLAVIRGCSPSRFPSGFEQRCQAYSSGGCAGIDRKQLTLRTSVQINNGTPLICKERQNDTFVFPKSNKTMDGFICVVIENRTGLPVSPVVK